MVSLLRSIRSTRGGNVRLSHVPTHSALPRTPAGLCGLLLQGRLCVCLFHGQLPRRACSVGTKLECHPPRKWDDDSAGEPRSLLQTVQASQSWGPRPTAPGEWLEGAWSVLEQGDVSET